MEVKAANLPGKSDTEPVPDQEYVMAGRLTRLPVPMTDIDLNVVGINDSDVIGKVELTVLINSDGTVADVVPVVEMESASAFAERVAQRFRIARFMPGEVNGKAVNAQVRITVVSESFAETERKSEIDSHQ